jgi:hypothetical protein
VLLQMTWPPQSTDLNPIKIVWDGLSGGAVIKGAVLQRQLCHQRLWVRAQALL